MDIRPVLFIVGIQLLVLAAANLLPAAVDAAASNPDWQVFLVSAAVTAFFGGLLALGSRTGEVALDLRQVFLLTTLSWIAVGLFAALPFRFATLGLDYADAAFEAVSGITTTGSTVIVGLDRAPPGILLWRSLLQWLGGIGIIVMGLSLLPLMRVGGMQLFRSESSDRSEKLSARVGQATGQLLGTYLILTALCGISLWFAGMSGFDATCHAMTTIATGGFSTRDASIGHFGSVAIEAVMILFMLLGATTFSLLVQAARGDPHPLWRDQQVRLFLAYTIGFIAIIALWRVARGEAGPLEALRGAAFNVVSVVTTSGFASADYATWGSLPVAAFLFVIVLGGTTGSTAGGIKAFRFHVLIQVARAQLVHMTRPHQVVRMSFNGRAIQTDVVRSVLGFFWFFGLSLALLTLGLAATGLDLVTSLSGAAQALANVGPGLGEVIGPAGNFAPLPDAAKWMLVAGMLLGRLELLTILVLLSPAFWRN